jgi:DNA-binding IclR family transcriptional regulator
MTPKTRISKTPTPAGRRTAKAKGQPAVESLTRGLQILRCFSQSRTTLTVTQLANLTSLPQPTVWRLCKTLKDLGYLSPVPNGNHLRPGLPLLSLGFAALSNTEFPEIARAELQALATRFGGVCSLCIRDQLSMLYVQRCESTPLHIINLRVGSLVPIADSGNGWAYLAGLSGEARNELVQVLRVQQAALWKKAAKPFARAMDEFAKGGVMFNLGVFHPNVNSAAVPIQNEGGGTSYTISCSAPPAILSAAQLRREIGPALKQVAAKLTLAIRSSRA